MARRTKILIAQMLLTATVMVSIYPTKTFGFTQLQSSHKEACIGEQVTLSCATSWVSIRWEVTLRDGVTSTSYFYDIRDSPGLLYTTLLSGVGLNFELLSNSMGILNSTLAVVANSVLNNAEIECQGEDTRVHTFKLAGIPPKPTNVSLSKTTYEMAASNVTLSWNEPTTGRILFFIVNITSYTLESLSLTTNVPSIALDGIPYGQDINVTITSVNCYSENEGDLFVISLYRCTKIAPEHGHLVLGSLTMETSIPGEEIVYTCNPGYSPQLFTRSVCQENGKWSPDPREMLCLMECQLPILNDFLEIINESTVTNSTVLGSKLHFRCKDDTVSTIQLATCVEGGQWFPNPENHMCQLHQDEDHTEQPTIIKIVGGVTGSILLCLLTIMCGMCVCIIKLRKNRRMEQFDLNIAPPEPVYETIVDPSYAGLCDIQKETELMFNDAYNFGMCKQDQYSL